MILLLWNSFFNNEFFCLKLQWVHVSGGLLILNMSAIIINCLVQNKQNKKANYLLVTRVETLCSFFCLLELRKMLVEKT